MPEIKNNFTQGRMNKDLDERLVPMGEYTHAMNIQVTTSDGADVGALQNVLGNQKLSNLAGEMYHSTPVCVGSISDEKNNAVYWLVNSNIYLAVDGDGNPIDSTPAVSKDLILEYKNNILSPVLVDIKNVMLTLNDGGVVTTGGPAGAGGPLSLNPINFTIDTYNQSETPPTSLQIAPGLPIVAPSKDPDSKLAMVIDYASEPGYLKVLSGLHRGMTTSITSYDGTIVVTTSLEVTEVLYMLGEKVVVYFKDNKSEDIDGFLPTNFGSSGDWSFDFQKPKPALNFQVDNSVGTVKLITGINILDGNLFFTDNKNEPKKINIERSKKGTIDYNYQSMIINEDRGIGVPVNINNRVPVEEHHITVIKKSPLSAPNLKMISTAGQNISCFAMPTTNNGNSTNFELFIDSDGQNKVIPRFTEHTLTVINEQLTPFNWLEGDVILLKSTGLTSTSTPNENLLPVLDDFQVRARIVSFDNAFGNAGGPGQEVKLIIEILSIDAETPQSTSLVFAVSKEDISEKLFKDKFCRFGYRWKYIDGEYSCFSPFSEIAFVSGGFDHHPIKGYNLAMSNTIKELIVQDFITPDMPEDVVEVDILYKETTSPNVYVVETLRYNDPIASGYTSSSTGVSKNAWRDYGSSYDIGPNGTYIINQDDLDLCKVKGSYKIKSELIFKTLPSEQLLRAFDNVPRKALAQEIVGNRLLFGNYEQNFDLKNHKIKFGSFTSVPYDPVGPQGTLGKKSIKSLREYQVGVVYTDAYGRETPVITDETGGYRAPKFSASDYNNLQVKISGLQPSFAEYYKFYIKETSNEYYNLSMDRMYDGEDGSVWVSFPSADRNKIDEDTYLILKKGNGQNNAISQEAKYKVLAIANEAPSSIKETKKILGSLSITPNTVSFPGSVAVEMLTASPAGTDSFVLSILSTNAPKFSDRTLIDLDKITNKLKFRFVASENNGDTKGNISKFHEISSVTKTPSTTDDVTLNVKLKSIIDDDPGTTAFDDHFIFNTTPTTPPSSPSLSGTSTHPTTGLETYSYLEFYEFIEENKPEFDGRFFVKIYADEVVIENFTKIQETEDYLTVSSMPLFYINETDGTDFVDTQLATDELVKGVGSTDGMMDTYSEWSTFLSSIYPTVSAKNKKYRWFIDDTNYYAPAKKQGNKYVVDTSATPDDLLTTSPATRGTAYGISNPSTTLAKNDGINATNKTIDISYFGIGNKEYDLPAHAEAFVDTLKIGNFIQLGSDVGFYKITNIRRQNFVNYNWNTINHGSFSTNDSSAIEYGSQQRATFRIYLDTAYGSSPSYNALNPSTGTVPNHENATSIRVYTTYNRFDNENKIDENPAIWETEPKEGVDLDVYYEASNELPIKVNRKNDQLFIPIGSEIIAHPNIGSTGFDDCTLDQDGSKAMIVNRHNNGYLTVTNINENTNLLLTNNSLLKVKHPITGKIMIVNVSKAPLQPTSTATTGEDNYYSNTDTFYVETNHNGIRELDFSNCFSFGNGVESNRIKDTFNLPTIDNGVKVSTVLDEPFEKERRSSGLIYSGIYNSNSGINNTNQFIAANKITKDLNPTYGSIQKLHTRNDDVVALCEDKVLRIFAQKDALFNADGSTNVAISAKVLGHAEPFSGDYGISKNPESFCSEEFRSYFVDKTRRAVLRLSKDGITPISDYGMTNWFQENLNNYDLIIGGYDDRKKEYNITLKNYNAWYDTTSSKNYLNELPISSYVNEGVTITYNEKNRGWVSFKSFVAESALSCANKYYTFNLGEIYEHHIEGVYNTFYGQGVDSEVTFLMNQAPSSVKNYTNLNYEGTQTRVVQNLNPLDIDYYNLNGVDGWYCENLETDQEEGFVPEFIEKEGKWFNYIKGRQTNLNLSSFNFQGLGTPATSGPPPNFNLLIQDLNDND